jgi:cytochrome c biogenesis protein CcmG/thiol:disulfide interchange protein DsbE
MPSVGQPAPDFGLKALDGSQVRLSDLRGKPVLINFWASWCGPCRQEMPVIEKAYQAQKGNGFHVLAVNDTYQDNVDDVRQLANELGVSFPVLLDEQGQVTEMYHVFGLPSSFFVDDQGIIRAVHTGPLTESMLADYLK